MRSGAWHVAGGTVLSAERGSDATGCSIVIICYEYTIEGERYGGCRTKAFVLNASAEEYKSTLPKGTHLKVRVTPENCSVSIIWMEPWLPWKDRGALTFPLKTEVGPRVAYLLLSP